MILKRGCVSDDEKVSVAVLFTGAKRDAPTGRRKLDEQIVENECDTD